MGFPYDCWLWEEGSEAFSESEGNGNVLERRGSSWGM